MSEPLDSLVMGWKRHFAAADAQIEWLGSSVPLQLELVPGVWLVGELDVVGRTGTDLFFGEWKTANPREKKTWKQTWRMNPQSLSYGVLARSRWPEMRRFTVRKAFKELTPTYDHAWFRYSDAELDHWENQVKAIAYRLDAYRLFKTIPWQTNFSRCFKFGVNYACPFFESSCNKLDWGAVPDGATNGGDPNWSMTHQREKLTSGDPRAIVLSPTTIVDFLDCEEMYRRKYVELVTPEKNEALQLGGDFHNVLGAHYAGQVTSGANNITQVEEAARGDN